MAEAKENTGRASRRPDDGRRGRRRDADRPRPRHDLRAAGRAERPAVRGPVQGAATACARSTPATSRARPIWRSARRSRPASRRPTPWCRGRACSIPAAALLTAYAMNAPVLALIGQIPDADIGRASRPPARDPRPGRHHQAAGRSFGADPQARAGAARWSPRRCARWRPAGRARPSLECAIDVWGKSGPVTPQAPLPVRAAEDRRGAIRKAAKLLGAAKNPLIVCGGGAQDASAEVTALSAMLQAPVLGYRRGRGVLDSRDPLSVTLPLGRELWGEADVVLGVGTPHADPVPAMGHRQATSRSSASMPTPRSPAACTSPRWR